jgi:hypothetical protein
MQRVSVRQVVMCRAREGFRNTRIIMQKCARPAVQPCGTRAGGSADIARTGARSDANQVAVGICMTLRWKPNVRLEYVVTATCVPDPARRYGPSSDCRLARSRGLALAQRAMGGLGGVLPRGDLRCCVRVARASRRSRLTAVVRARATASPTSCGG